MSGVDRSTDSTAIGCTLLDIADTTVHSVQHKAKYYNHSQYSNNAIADNVVLIRQTITGIGRKSRPISEQLPQIANHCIKNL